MQKLKVFSYSILWIIHVISTFVLFPTLEMSCVIPVIPLVGLGVWMFGTTAGLYFALTSVIHNFFLTGLCYADQIVFYQYKLSGYILLIALIYLLGKLRANFENIRATKAHLDMLVHNRTQQLSSLTDQLLHNSENLKNTSGQKLHDGMGQQLTGIQLLSASLSEQLLNESNSIAAVTHHLRSQAAAAHQNIRRISRLLFPVRIGQVGLVPALRELSSCISEIKPIAMKISETENLSTSSEEVSLQLYRICQETTLNLIDHHKADRIDIHISESRRNYHIHINHNGSGIQEKENSGAFRLIEYRLKKIAGTIKSNTSQTEFSIPKESAKRNVVEAA